MVTKGLYVSTLLFLLFLQLNAQVISSTGTGGAYTIANYPGNFTGYYDGFSVIFKANHVCPASPTLNINGFGPINIINAAAVVQFDANSSLTNAFRLERDGQIGISTNNPLAKLDARGSNLKTTTFPLEYIFQIGSLDASPFTLRMGIHTNATSAARCGAIEVDEGGVKRKLELQPSGGDVGIGSLSGTGGILTVNGPSATFNNPSGSMNITVSGSLLNGSSFYVNGVIKAGASPTPGANTILALKDGHLQTQQQIAPMYPFNTSNVSSGSVSGTDIAGQVTYSILPGATLGDFITVIFNKYVNQPIVLLTPQNPTAAAAISGHEVYVTTTLNSFTINHNVSANTRPIISSQISSFNYLVVDR